MIRQGIDAMHPRHHADITPDPAAVVMADSGVTLSFGELERRAIQGAHPLRRLGLRTGATVAFWLTNTTMLRLPEATRRRYDLSSLQNVIHAAAPCPIQIKRQMIDWLGPIIDQCYGGSEGNRSTSITSTEWLKKPGGVQTSEASKSSR
jgi:acyl-CoA synthetase (AMP-forming)/AMP-acid ligase II